MNSNTTLKQAFLEGLGFDDKTVLDEEEKQDEFSGGDSDRMVYLTCTFTVDPSKYVSATYRPPQKNLKDAAKATMDEAYELLVDAFVEDAGPRKKVTRENCDTPMSECKAENPLFCRFHGPKLLEEDIKTSLRSAERFPFSLNITRDKDAKTPNTFRLTIGCQEKWKNFVKRQIHRFMTQNAGISSKEEWEDLPDGRETQEFEMDIERADKPPTKDDAWGGESVAQRDRKVANGEKMKVVKETPKDILENKGKKEEKEEPEEPEEPRQEEPAHEPEPEENIQEEPEPEPQPEPEPEQTLPKKEDGLVIHGIEELTNREIRDKVQEFLQNTSIDTSNMPVPMGAASGRPFAIAVESLRYDSAILTGMFDNEGKFQCWIHGEKGFSIHELGSSAEDIENGWNDYCAECRKKREAEQNEIQKSRQEAEQTIKDSEPIRKKAENEVKDKARAAIAGMTSAQATDYVNSIINGEKSQFLWDYYSLDRRLMKKSDMEKGDTYKFVAGMLPEILKSYPEVRKALEKCSFAPVDPKGSGWAAIAAQRSLIRNPLTVMMFSTSLPKAKTDGMNAKRIAGELVGNVVGYTDDSFIKFRACLMHEIGHLFVFRHTRENDTSGNASRNQSYMSMWRKIVNIGRKEQQEWDKKISHYGTQNMNELHSECMALYTLPGYGKRKDLPKLPNAVEEFIRKELTGK